MEKMCDKNCITLDGRLDEAVWETAEAHTGFKTLGKSGGKLVGAQTIFKILPCEDRIYVGVKCLEPNEMDKVLERLNSGGPFTSSSVELYFSPSGSNYEYYQFIITIRGDTYTQYYSEGGNIRPDKYAPDWNRAVYIGEDYWSCEVEIPLTAFYWTGSALWSTKWLMNITRSRNVSESDDPKYSTWSPLQFNFLEPVNFLSLDGFPQRPMCDEVRITEAAVELTDETVDGYCGTMTVKTNNAVAGTFAFSSSHAETKTVTLEAGSNEFTVPCIYQEMGRARTMLSLTRLSDGKVFKRYYPVLVEFEPIKFRLTLPEYRSNFYPGQDYSKIAGTVKAAKPVTLKLEGPGIETQVLTPGAGGSFQFDTPNFEIGEAWLTATIDGYTAKQKIRRLAPSGHRMSWISAGNLVVDGKPVLRRDMYARTYRIGTAFQRKYDADDLHETWFGSQKGGLEPRILMPKSEQPGGEATKDGKPSEEMMALVDEVLEANKDQDFTYYYLSDEPECRGLSPVYFKHLYKYIADKDPYHVILIASRSADSNVEFADWFEAHPYINVVIRADGKRVYERPLNTLGSYIDKITKLNRPDKCIGFLPTCFAYKWETLAADYPNLAEVVAHTWAAMIHGGKTLWPYAGHDMNDRPSLYEGMRYIFTSFEALESLVLHGKRTTLARTADYESVLYDNGDEKLFVLVNFTQEPQTVTLDGLTGQWHEFRGSRTFTGNTFDLAPLETVIGTNVVKDAGLPTYAETAAVVDEMEYARTHTGSLLFERAADIAVTHKGTVHTIFYKLFDGVKDNLACNITDNPESFIELDLTKVKPTFTKVTVNGYCIEKAQLKLRVNGELVMPAVTGTKTAEYEKTFLLAEAVSPDALRFEFGGQQGELYEIAVF